MIGIIDYSLGNLFSVKNALDYLNIESIISSDKDKLGACNALILPGVGAFGKGISELKARGLDVFIKEYIKTKPLLGICLGMQLLFDKSYEFGEHEGLSLIGGEIVRFQDDLGLSVPHMGWNELIYTNKSKITNENRGDFVYFVHSYYAKLADESNLIAYCDYNIKVPAIVAKGNVYGAQFHPEKSDECGLEILRNFERLTR